MGTVEQDTARYMKEQDSIQRQEAHEEALYDSFREDLDKQKPLAIQSYMAFLWDCSFSGMYSGSNWETLEDLWANSMVYKQMEAERLGLMIE